MADPIAELIDRLLASGKLSGETRGELGEYKQELANGRLEAGDRRYVEALAQRLLGTRAPANDAAAPDEEASESLDSEALWDIGEDSEIAELRARAEAAEARVAELEQEIERLKAERPEG